MKRSTTPWGHLAALAALVTLLCGATQCSYRGHTFGAASGTGQATAGAVAGFGSVFVGGTEFTTGGATLTIDGAVASESQLKVGQVALVKGTVASGATSGPATSVAVRTRLVGPVTAVDAAAGTLTVLGQRVFVDGDTSVAAAIAPGDVNGVAIGTVVAVDGYRNSTGLVASRLDRAATGQLLRITGVVSALSGFAQSFQIGATLVDFSSSGGLPAGVGNGSYVVATGATVGDATTLHASSVVSDVETPAGGNGEIGFVHGAVTRFASATDFDVAGQRISTSGATTYPTGASTSLALDVECTVTGSYDSGGALAAATIDAPAAPTFRVVGPIDALLSGISALQVAGVTLATDTQTRWDDRSAAALRTLRYADLRSGDWVEVRGVAALGRAVAVHVVERGTAPASGLVELQDVPSGIADPQFTLAGIVIDTRGATFGDATGLALSRSAFFAQLSGRVVRAVGTYSGGTLTASSVALRQ